MAAAAAQGSGPRMIFFFPFRFGAVLEHQTAKKKEPGAGGALLFPVVILDLPGPDELAFRGTHHPFPAVRKVA